MATTYDKASLVMIPSGVKESKLYSIKPTDGSGDFNFSRGTDTATRVNSSGLIEKERSNQLLQSNSFDTTWTNSNTTETGGQSGYDGSSDAWLLTKTSASGNIYQGKSYSGVNTFSIYAKGNTTDWIRLRNTGAYVYFDVTNGVVGGNINAISPSITSVGSGWYRCEVAWDGIGTITQVFVADSDGSTSGTSGSVYIQDAQLEQGLVATDYIETTTAAVYEGITDNLPRLDYSGGASCPSLLLEPSRTNIIDQSEFFDAWTGTAVYTANTDISPSGYQDAATLNDNTTAYLDRRKSPAITANTTHTYSLFVKKTTGSLTHYAGFAVLLTGGSAVVDYGIINTTTGAINRDASSNVNSVSYSSESYGNYWRVIMTFTDNQSNTLCTCIVYPAISTNGTSISQTAQGSNVFWGAQLEAGSYPTSYIPTYGTSASRAGDLPKVTGVSDLIGQTEGTLFVDVDFNGVNHSVSQTAMFVRTAGANTGYVFINFYLGKLNVGLRVAGSTLFDILIGSTLAARRYKIAFAYKSGDIAFYVNGSLIDTRASAFGTTSFADVHLGGVSGNQLGDGHRQALLFKTRLTNAELAELTTI